MEPEGGRNDGQASPVGSTGSSNHIDDVEDAEGVWSPDIDQSFQEALAIYPPCGRRKIILSDEGKMYGRNELIARYIKLRTGKSRSRKQVSSHIQVLARKKAREIQSKMKQLDLDQTTKDKALQQLSQMSSAQIVSASAIQNKSPSVTGLELAMRSPLKSGTPPTCTYQQTTQINPPQGQYWQPQQLQTNVLPQASRTLSPIHPNTNGNQGYVHSSQLYPSTYNTSLPWKRTVLGGSRLQLTEFSAYVDIQRDTEVAKHVFVHLGGAPSLSYDPEAVDIRQIYDKFPERRGGLKELFESGPANAFFLVKFWADLNTTIPDERGAYFGVTSEYESCENMVITCATKVCSFGKQVVEKLETEYGHFENGKWVYRIHRSPMCEYMVNFVHKLRSLPEKSMMNSVLENFTILQVVTHKDTEETLLCIAYVFEISTSEHGAQHHMYKLVKD